MMTGTAPSFCTLQIVPRPNSLPATSLLAVPAAVLALRAVDGAIVRRDGRRGRRGHHRSGYREGSAYGHPGWAPMRPVIVPLPGRCTVDETRPDVCRIEFVGFWGMVEPSEKILWCQITSLSS